MIESFRRELRKMSEAAPTEAELARAKDSILKGAAFDFDSTGKIVRRLMTYEYFGYPEDYLQQYQAAVRKVTAADVLRVAKQYVRTDRLAIVVLGNQKEFGTPLGKLGEVKPIDISIPEPK
jgi:zinc protease